MNRDTVKIEDLNTDPYALNEMMGFGTVIRVANGEAVTAREDEGTGYSYAGESVYMRVDRDGQQVGTDADLEDAPRAPWETHTGASGQYSYSGPVMHVSEFIGGGLARHILETPGYWVTLSVECLPDWEDATEDEMMEVRDDPAGWIIYHIPAE